MNAQLSLIDESAIEWDSDSYETPDWLAQKIAALITPDDKHIVEPAAGTGQIALQIPVSGDRMVLANELKQLRFEVLEERLKHRNSFYCRWSNFLDWASDPNWDVVITNPPFSKALAFVEQGLKMLDRHNPDSRLLYLLPGDTFASKERNAHFQALDCHIHHRYEVVGRVAYLKQGVPQQGRQIQDAVFDIRPGKAGGCVTFI